MLLSFLKKLVKDRNEEVLSNDNIANIWKQKTIGTRKHNSEAATITGHAKDSDASSVDPPVKNTQGTSSNMYGSGDE